MKRLLYIILFVGLGQIANAQQLPIYSQYLYNKFMINPAHAGSDGFTSINMTAREQWVGYEGAPQTYSLSFQTRILKKGYALKQNIFNRTSYRPKTDGKIGLGGYIFSDRNGLIQRTGFQASYSYHMWLSDYTQLSMGLAFTGYHFIIKADESSFHDPSEPWLNDNLRRGVFIPDADFGVYLLSNKYDIGFSALQLFGAAAKLGDDAYKNFQMDRHYYLFGSYYWDVADKTELQPSLLMKVSEQLRPQADIGLNYIYDQKIWAGIAYRTSGGLITNIRFRYIPANSLTSAIFFGYAIDFTLNEMQKATWGTHELTVAVKFGSSLKRYRWLDRY